MAKSKSRTESAEVAALDAIIAKAKAAKNPWHKRKFTKAEREDSALFCQLPYIKDTRGEIYHADAGLYWWHVTDPVYWHQGIEVGKAFADRTAVVLSQNPKRIEEVLCHSLESMLYQGGSNGVAIGFLRQLAHYAAKGMQQSTASSN
jgi:hypothetical protein